MLGARLLLMGKRKLLRKYWAFEIPILFFLHHHQNFKSEVTVTDGKRVDNFESL